MTPSAPPLLDRIVTALARAAGPRSSGDLAREFLGLGLVDEIVAERILGVQLAADPRFERASGGWVLAAGSVASRSVALDEPSLAVFAPHAVPVAGVSEPPGGAPPGFTIAAGGEAEVRRAEERLGRRLPRPVIDLATACRRLRGYRGAADPLALAERLGTPHLEVDTPDGRAAIAHAVWHTLAAELRLEDVTDVAALERLVDARLEAADLAGTEFGTAGLGALTDGPGVYVFRDHAGAVLYVGQSSCLSARVFSYFNGPPRDEKDRAIRTRAVRLTTRAVDTACDALVLEARTIRRLRPALNTRLKVRGAPPARGVLAVPRAGRTLGAVFFVLGEHGLVLRVPAPRGAKRASAAARRAAAALFADPATLRHAPDREAGALLDSWRRAHTEVPFFEAGVHGDADDIAARLVRCV